MQTRLIPLTAALVLSAGANGGDWPNWRGPAHNGISDETGWQSAWPAAGPKRLWRADVGTGFASVTVSGDRVFTLGNRDDTDTVYCLEAASGKVAWSYEYKQELAPKFYEGGPSATPTVDGDRVFTLSKSGLVHCLNAGDGSVVWSRDLAGSMGLKAPTWGFSGSVLVEGDLLILNAGDSGTALRKDSGEVVWTSGEGPSGYSTPVPFVSDGKRCVALMGEDEFLAVQVDDGTVVWRFPWKTRYDVNAADPVPVDAGRFFITSGYNHGCALVRVTGAEPAAAWENKNMRSQFASPVLWEGHLYGVDDKEMVCLNVESGEVLWSERSVGKGSLMMANELLIVLSDKGELSVVEPSPAGFKAVSRAQVLGGKCWTVPVLANGRIYCRNAKGELVCLDVRGAD